jgi:cell fate regulator YaaT (PSP1 superfamily)
MSPYIVGIRFQSIGKIYHFDASQIPDIQAGDFVIVDTSRGTQVGQVIQVIQDPQRPPEGAWKPVQRKATPQDLVLRQIWQRKEVEALAICRSKAVELNLTSVKFVAAEYSFDGSRLSFMYCIEEGEKIDLAALRRALLHVYPHTQIDLHQVGPRDVAKMLGGMGACGLECRCCSTFLTDFSPVSIKMAKEQGISLTPTEITGMCGRLRCCLVYEYEQYAEARKHLPKRNKRVVTSLGNGRVLDVLPLQDAVIVELDSGARQTFKREEIQPWNELEALKQKAQAPCEKSTEMEEEGEEGTLDKGWDEATPEASLFPKETQPPVSHPPRVIHQPRPPKHDSRSGSHSSQKRPQSSTPSQARKPRRFEKPKQ